MSWSDQPERRTHLAFGEAEESWKMGIIGAVVLAVGGGVWLASSAEAHGVGLNR